MASSLSILLKDKTKDGYMNVYKFPVSYQDCLSMMHLHLMNITPFAIQLEIVNGFLNCFSYKYVEHAMYRQVTTTPYLI